jgi:hypothetical protein
MSLDGFDDLERMGLYQKNLLSNLHNNILRETPQKATPCKTMKASKTNSLKKQIPSHLVAFLSPMMQRFALLPLALILPLAAQTESVPKKPAASESADEWKPLYKGTLDDFRIYFRGQGYIKDVNKQDVFVAEPKQIHVRKGTNGLIVTKQPYTHYHVKVDYRWGARGGSMNAGLMSHVDLESKQVKDNRPRSIEINMKADAPGSFWMASKLGPFGSSFVEKGTDTFLAKDKGGVPRIANPFGKRTIFARYPGDGPNSKPRGEWNTLEAIVRGSESVEIIHNGQLVNRVTNLLAADISKKKATDQPQTSGGIGLQSEGQEIFYRNFVIKKLKP